MPKGIIYVMTTAVPGLIKIGKTGTSNFENRMYFLEQNGYRNITSLKRTFAIEVENFDDKEIMLHTIFGKSRVSNTELFAIDASTVIQLLSSFDGSIVYPKGESKNTIFADATESSKSKLIPDGEYHFKKYKSSDNTTIIVSAIVESGSWTLLAGSTIGIAEDAGVPKTASELRNKLHRDDNGKLLDNFELGVISPSCAGAVVMNQSINGWTDWKTVTGEPIDIFRKMITSDAD